MIVKLNKKRVKYIIEKYYRDEYGCDGKVTINVLEGPIDCYDNVGCVVNTKFKGRMSILGDETVFNIVLSIEDIECVIKKSFEKEGYDISDVSCDYGLDSRLEGFGMGEHVASYPYFRGAEVRIKNKVMEKGGI